MPERKMEEVRPRAWRGMIEASIAEESFAPPFRMSC